MKKIASTILVIVVAVNFAGCDKKYTEADLEKAYYEGLNEGIMAAEQEWDVGYEQGLRDGKKSSSGEESSGSSYDYDKEEALRQIRESMEMAADIRDYLEDPENSYTFGEDEAYCFAQDIVWKLSGAMDLLH